MRCAAATLAARVLAPAAAAWSPLATGVRNTTVPSLLVTQAGTVIVAYDTASGAIAVVRDGGPPRTLVSDDPVPARTQIVQRPNGALQLYFPNAQGVGRMTSTDDGQTWTGPVQTQSHTVGPVNSAAVGPDGTRTSPRTAPGSSTSSAAWTASRSGTSTRGAAATSSRLPWT